MTVYNYDASTGAYLGTTDARESPLESGVYLIPANATTIAPPELQDGYMACFISGSWTSVVIPVPVQPGPQPPSLEDQVAALNQAMLTVLELLG